MFSVDVRFACAVAHESFVWVLSVLLWRRAAMPYRHFMLAPMSQPGDDAAARMFLFDRLQGRGSILFHSTADNDLQYYQAYVSEASYTLFPSTQQWINYGTAWDYDNSVGSKVTLESMDSLCGPVYSEGYVFDAGGGDGVDLYLRCSSMLPTSRYYHYRLDAEDYRSWMDATWYELQGMIDKPEWAWTASTRL